MRVIERCLYTRNEHYYFRIALPRFIHPALGVKEIRLALRTQDLSEARLKAVRLDFDLRQKLKAFNLALEDSPDSAIETLLQELQELKAQSRPQSLTGYRMREGLCFSHIVKRYLDDCPADAHSTRVHKESTYEQFQDVMGDLVFKAIKIEQSREFKSRLLKIPANAKKIMGNQDWSKIDWETFKTDKLMHPRTINNRLSYLGVLFNWAIKAGYYHQPNPFSGLKIPKSQKVTSSRTHPFKQEELQAVFSSSLMRNPEQPSLLWVPLIGLYSGMRLNEICQLYVQDRRLDRSVFRGIGKNSRVRRTGHISMMSGYFGRIFRPARPKGRTVILHPPIFIFSWVIDMPEDIFPKLHEIRPLYR